MLKRRMDEIFEYVRAKVKGRTETYQELAERTGVNYWWLIKFPESHRISRRGFEHVQKLAAYFKERE